MALNADYTKNLIVKFDLKTGFCFLRPLSIDCFGLYLNNLLAFNFDLNSRLTPVIQIILSKIELMLLNYCLLNMMMLP